MSLIQRCIQCPSTPPACSCGPNEQCQNIGQSCTVCTYSICVPVDASNDPSSGGGGISTGALVGAIVAAIVVLILAALAIVYVRRRAAARRARDIAPPGGPPGTGEEAMPDHPYARAACPLSNMPLRPPRAPGLDLKAPDPLYAKGNKADKRQSVQTTGSSVMSDSESAVTVELYDARTQSATRHVFGAPAKALVVPINASSTSLPLQRSPLGQASYSVNQTGAGSAVEHDPFADRPGSRNSMTTVATYDPDNVQIMNATLTPLRASGASSGTGHIVAKGPIAARANLLPIRVPPQGLPSLIAYQTAIGQAAARPPPSPHDSLTQIGHARHLSSATTTTTASGFSTSSSLLSSFPFVPPSPLGLPRQRSPESMTFSVRDGEEGVQGLQVDKPTPPPPHFAIFRRATRPRRYATQHACHGAHALRTCQPRLGRSEQTGWGAGRHG
ncbi:hypothetical protein CALVIDRAFT_349236 [Calocera viscosa TUFC12733]|uniref:Membrane anchor Opy2 N-terminal domain-containing protein n=1 Tax=Calocera viscosa (strain TUFC12733) TaxID=1330018 RepID=A0A167H9U6_CALVF|nr:hypothetical protein CALVIDRAFT_349236 [Calocera viscosa TUFC12733]